MLEFCDTIEHAEKDLNKEKYMAQYEKIYFGVHIADQASDGVSAEAAAKEMAHRLSSEFGSKINMGITAHQLYEGSRSAYCFDMNLPRGSAQRAAQISWETVLEMCGEQSDPGLCVLPLMMEDDGMTEDLASHAERTRRNKILEEHHDLIRFGQRVKKEPAAVQEAFDAAAQFPAIILRGAGSRQGVVGALAAAGLRVGGDDGRFIGTYDMTHFSARTFGSVAQCIGCFRMKYGIDPIFAERTGGALGFHDKIAMIRDAKAVLNAGRFTLICALGGDDMWTPYTEDDFGKVRSKRRSCDYFELDEEERDRFLETKRRSCGTCLYRKLTTEGFVCTAGHEPVR